MIVQVPLMLDGLPAAASVDAIHGALCSHYEGRHFVTVADPAESAARAAQFEPEALNELYVRINREIEDLIFGKALASHIDRDAYEARTVSLSAGFERQSNFVWQKKWTWSLGAELGASGGGQLVELRFTSGVVNVPTR